MVKKSIAVARGDGIGAEIMDAVISIFNAVNIPLDYKFIDMGRDIFLQGHKMGMTSEAKATVEELGVLFKGPMETPKGGGNKSINVTARKMWGTFANCRTFKVLPGVETIHSKANIPINLTIIRENLEDTYGGVEHLINPNLGISRRFISTAGCYQIHKYSFEYAKQQGIKSVVCGNKANIMKITDGMFLDIFYEVAKDYPDIKASDVIVDDLCMKLVTNPDKFEVIVLPNLQGDIVSDLCAGLVGGLGFAPSANIGNNIAIFEAVHGTAPDIAGKNIANPTALLLSGLMMLNFLGFNKQAKKIELALFETLQDKVHTADLKISSSPVSTTDYAKAIVERVKKIDDNSPLLKDINENPIKLGNKSSDMFRRTTPSECVGIDLFIEANEAPKDLGDKLTSLVNSFNPNFTLELIANRGTAVYPIASKYTECIDSYLIRILSNKPITEIEGLELSSFVAKTYKLLSLEFLRTYEGKNGFTTL